MTATSPGPREAGADVGAPGQHLGNLLSRPNVMSRASSFEVDGISPAVAIRPGSAAEVAAVLEDAHEAGAAVIARGGGSHVGFGMPPRRYDVALDLSGLHQVIEYEPADLTVTVEAGVTLAALQSHLARHGQWLPLDPPVSPAATIGGILATNASGPARIAFGTARDLVIGLKVALADGQVVKSGGRVVKNVAGYDMAKMHIGGLGTLGVILEATFKVAPLPIASRTLAMTAPEARVLVGLAFRIRDAGLPATGIEISTSLGAESVLSLRFSGNAAAVDRSCREAERLAARNGLRAEQAPEAAWQRSGALREPSGVSLLRISHPPAAAGPTLEQMSHLHGDLVSLPTAGLAWARNLAVPEQTYATIRSLRASVEAGGGALVFESAPVEVKRALGVWGTPRSDFALTRRLKEQMDPRSILSPGRYVGDL